MPQIGGPTIKKGRGIGRSSHLGAVQRAMKLEWPKQPPWSRLVRADAQGGSNASDREATNLRCIYICPHLLGQLLIEIFGSVPRTPGRAPVATVQVGGRFHLASEEKHENLESKLSAFNRTSATQPQQPSPKADAAAMQQTWFDVMECIHMFGKTY